MHTAHLLLYRCALFAFTPCTWFLDSMNDFSLLFLNYIFIYFIKFLRQKKTKKKLKHVGRRAVWACFVYHFLFFFGLTLFRIVTSLWLRQTREFNKRLQNSAVIFMYYLYNKNILEYSEIVETGSNSWILNIEGYSIVYL